MIIGGKKANKFNCPYFLIHIYRWRKPFRMNIGINEGGRIFVLNLWLNRNTKDTNFFYIAIRTFGKWYRHCRAWNKKESI